LTIATGEWDRGMDALREAQTLLRDAGRDREIIQVVVARSVIAYLQDRRDEAQQSMDEVLLRYGGVGDDWGKGVALLFSLRLAAERGDVGKAVSLAEELLNVGVESHSGRVLYLGAAGTAWLGRNGVRAEEEARLIGAAEAMYQAMGLVADLVGRLFFAPAMNAVQERMPREDLAEARRAGRRMTSPEIAVLCSQILEDVHQASGRTEPSRESSPAGVLSAREMEVLELVAEGYTNKQIARQLIIAESTVRYHLTSIFNKLGVDTRTHALAVAAQRGLIHLG